MGQGPRTSGDPFRRLSAAIIKCAWQDAKGRPEADQAWGLAWLASSRATEFFDEIEIAQSTWLLNFKDPHDKVSWRGLARQVLQDPPEEASAEDLQVISATLAYLDSLEARRHAR